MTCWIDVVEENFPVELYFAGYKGNTGWILRGPFVEEERARESLQYFYRMPRKIFKFNLDNIESLMKMKAPKFTITDTKTGEQTDVSTLTMKVRQPKKREDK